MKEMLGGCLAGVSVGKRKQVKDVAESLRHACA